MRKEKFFPALVIALLTSAQLVSYCVNCLATVGSFMLNYNLTNKFAFLLGQKSAGSSNAANFRSDNNEPNSGLDQLEKLSISSKEQTVGEQIINREQLNTSGTPFEEKCPPSASAEKQIPQEVSSYMTRIPETLMPKRESPPSLEQGSTSICAALLQSTASSPIERTKNDQHQPTNAFNFPTRSPQPTRSSSNPQQSTSYATVNTGSPSGSTFIPQTTTQVTGNIIYTAMEPGKPPNLVFVPNQQPNVIYSTRRPETLNMNQPATGQQQMMSKFSYLTPMGDGSSNESFQPERSQSGPQQTLPEVPRPERISSGQLLSNVNNTTTMQQRWEGQTGNQQAGNVQTFHPTQQQSSTSQNTFAMANQIESQRRNSEEHRRVSHLVISEPSWRKDAQEGL